VLLVNKSLIAFVIVLFILVLATVGAKLADRTSSPEAALTAAKWALRFNHLESYYDALTDEAVRQSLKNSIAICFSSGTPELQQYGYNKSEGCELILERHGWIEPTEETPEKFEAARNAAMEKIADPRKMAVELETNHRKHGAGTSFVWSYLEQVEIESVSISGSSAIAEVTWLGKPGRMTFEKDETGWRMHPFPDE
jgi:hypothetical protein